MTMAWAILSVILGVLIVGVLLYYGMSWVGDSADRSEKDPAYRRRVLFWGAIMYAASAVYVVGGVMLGKAVPETLLGPPISAVIIWFLLRAARKSGVPPEQ